jgi:hypothetical protein
MGLICGVDGKDLGLGIRRGEGCEWKETRIWELGHERGCLGRKNIHGARLGYGSHRIRDAGYTFTISPDLNLTYHHPF